MPSVQFNQQASMLRAIDTNSNRKLEELDVNDELKGRIDSNRDGDLSLEEVASALKSDTVDIQGKTLIAGQKKDITIHGLETLRNVHTILDKTLSAPHVWAPRVSDNVGAAVELVGALAGVEDKRSYAERRRDENRELNSSSTAYLLAVGSMRSTLRSVEDMTANAGDSRSKALNAQAKSSLNRSAAWTAGSLVGGLLFGSARAENTAIQIAYDAAKVTMVNMREQTKDLPDPARSLSLADKSIGNGLSTIDQARRLQSGADGRSQQLTANAQKAEAKVTGRTKPFALAGAAIGAAAGAAAGYYLNGHNLKAAAIGAGVGAAGTAGLAALIGSGIDKSYVAKAQSLRAQAQAVQSYQPEQAQQQLDQESLKLYQQLREASQVHDIDRAQVIDTQLRGTQQRIDVITNKANEIVKLYGDKK